MEKFNTREKVMRKKYARKSFISPLSQGPIKRVPISSEEFLEFITGKTGNDKKLQSAKKLRSGVLLVKYNKNTSQEQTYLGK